jgi:hypothetical protein
MSIDLKIKAKHKRESDLEWLRRDRQRELQDQELDAAYINVLNSFSEF